MPETTMTFIRPALGLLLSMLLVSAPNPAAAAEKPLTVEQIIALSRGGVSDAVIIAMMDRDKPVFVIDARRVVRLQQDCLSAPLIQAMQTSGHPDESRPVIAVTTSGVPLMPGVVSPCAFVPTAFVAPPTSTRGIFFAQPTAGIFFNPPKR